MGLQLRRVCSRVEEGERGAADTRGAVSVAPCRPVLGKTDKAEDLRANPKERKMEDNEECDKVRKSSEADPSGAKPHQPSATLVRSLRRTSRGVCPRSSGLPVSQAAEDGRYFLDGFSGSGGVAKAVRRQGFTAKEFELLHGEFHFKINLGFLTFLCR